MKIKKVIIGCMIIGIIIMAPDFQTAMDVLATKSDEFVLVVDSGHGGPDSGAVAADGTEEKDLNLAIAKAVAKEAKKYGIKVIMTRTDDVGLYDENDSGKWSKVKDMKERKRIIDESGADMALTIHLNSFKEDISVRGAQVFFPKNSSEQLYEENEQLAKEIQQSLIMGIADGSNRVAMEKNDILIFRDVKVKTVLVECGFLSNIDDKNNLKITKFQQKIAVYIIKGIASHFGLNIQKK